MRRLGIVAILLALVGVGPTAAQNTQLLFTARSATVQSDVVFAEDNKFHESPIPLAYINQSGLWTEYRPVPSKGDIIINFHKDVTSIGYETVSLTVFDPEDNSVIYSESRKLVDEENDVNRLVAHFLAKVSPERASERARRAQEAEAAERARRAQEAEAFERARRAQAEAAERARRAQFPAATQTLAVYSTSKPLVESLIEANRSDPYKCRVYLTRKVAQELADVVLEEKVETGQYILTLKSSDTNEVLHQVEVPEKSAARAVITMEKWINSTDWQ